MFTRRKAAQAVDPPSTALLPSLPSAQCTVLLALVEHLAAHKAHKSKLFQLEGRPSERKTLLEHVYAGTHPTSLKPFSSRSMSFVVRHVLATQYAPLLPYPAYDKLVSAVQAPHAAAFTAAVQTELNAMPSAHAKLLQALCLLMDKVCMQLMVAEEGLVVHLGVHLCRPSENPKTLQGTVGLRRNMCTRLLGTFRALDFGGKSRVVTPAPGHRRRSSCRTWSPSLVQDTERFLAYILASNAPKQDLFLRQPDTSNVQMLLANNSIAVDQCPLHDVAGVVKAILHRTDALVPEEMYSLCQDPDGHKFHLALTHLPPLHRRIVWQLFRCIVQAVQAGASIELLSAALSCHIFSQLKFLGPASGGAATKYHRHELERLATQVLRCVEAISRRHDATCGSFRVAVLAVRVALRLKGGLRRDLNALRSDETAPSHAQEAVVVLASCAATATSTSKPHSEIRATTTSVASTQGLRASREAQELSTTQAFTCLTAADDSATSGTAAIPSVVAHAIAAAHVNSRHDARQADRVYSTNMAIPSDTKSSPCRNADAAVPLARSPSKAVSHLDVHVDSTSNAHAVCKSTSPARQMTWLSSHANLKAKPNRANVGNARSSPTISHDDMTTSILPLPTQSALPRSIALLTHDDTTPANSAEGKVAFAPSLATPQPLLRPTAVDSAISSVADDAADHPTHSLECSVAIDHINESVLPLRRRSSKQGHSGVGKAASRAAIPAEWRPIAPVGSVALLESPTSKAKVGSFPTASHLNQDQQLEQDFPDEISKMLQQPNQDLAAQLALWEHLSTFKLFDATGRFVPWSDIATLVSDPSETQCRERFEALRVPLARPKALWRVLYAIYAAYKAPHDVLEWPGVQRLCRDCLLPCQSHQRIMNAFRSVGSTTTGLAFHQFYGLLAHFDDPNVPGASTIPIQDVVMVYLLPSARRTIDADKVQPSGQEAQWPPQLRRLVFRRLPAIKMLCSHFARPGAARRREPTTMRLQFREMLAWLQHLHIVPDLANENIVRERFLSSLGSCEADGQPSIGMAFPAAVAWIMDLGLSILSHPRLARVYSTEVDKVLVVLDVWGLADETLLRGASVDVGSFEEI
ncbi:hypothetical protein H310_07082 [Aphanomyces invadans]|uniref:Rho-GAP domain-containing protein n=1 Tax=Aphanomyces invadans TaxID=157072 RepID=A0A024U220_9STRA|nr:hypothetical protein H310_07082 [Aphanomyces invadans]ETW00461.1 hypothetical protein H310_07082 [Aphanomyces invadans]|eukprot:XP_008870596.1 hypothetical protein H310_07082 [Aphanomyces invadans]